MCRPLVNISTAKTCSVHSISLRQLIARFSYKTSGPASILLYPKLVKKLDILIYNGDADSCVPYIGNEEWTTQLAAKKVIKQTSAWHPWYTEDKEEGTIAPAGYATTYDVEGSDNKFQFVTIRLAGFMCPSLCT